MIKTDGGLQNDEKLGRETRPPSAEDQVVGVLNSQARRPTNHIERIEQFLNIENADVPGMFLAGESGFEGFGCATMASASVMENDG